MLHQGPSIKHISSITHDAKVLVFGTGSDGVVYYTVKREGFENQAVASGTEPFGFEDWKVLPLNRAAPDTSVTEDEKANLAGINSIVLVRSVYNSDPSALKSDDAAVQLVSLDGHICVFRASNKRIQVNRFVLDGIANVLVPKFEVRFARSKQRLKPLKSKPANHSNKQDDKLDALDYRDADGNPFFEPALQLDFIGDVANGWFSVAYVPTSDGERGRWHIFVYNGTTLCLYSVSSTRTRLFDVKDYLYKEENPADPNSFIYRPIEGILRRDVGLNDLIVKGAPSAATYDLQRERITDAGPQLLRDATRLMVAVPVLTTGKTSATAVIDYGIAADGSLSIVDAIGADPLRERSVLRDVITPVTLFDNIKTLVDTSPPATGTIVATERSDGDLLQIRSQDALPPGLTDQSKIEIKGTQSYDGLYQVVSKDDTSIQVAAQFTDDKAGTWVEVPAKQTGLVFNDMIVGAERTADGKLKLLCPVHDLLVGDYVQISGTQVYDGTYPIKSINATSSSIELDAPFFTGVAANLRTVMRRGLRMDGNDRVITPDLGLPLPVAKQPTGRTISAWVRRDASGATQTLVNDASGLMRLYIEANKLKLAVRRLDGKTEILTDTVALATNTWVHCAGTVVTSNADGGSMTITLLKDGNVVSGAPVVIKNQDGLAPPAAKGGKAPGGMRFATSYYDRLTTSSYPGPTRSITMSVWARSTKPYWNTDAYFMLRTGVFSLSGAGSSKTVKASLYGSPYSTKSVSSTLTDIECWHHYAATYDQTALTLYIDGEQRNSVALADPLIISNAGPIIGASLEYNVPPCIELAEAQLWNRALSKAEIATFMGRQLSGKEIDLAGYWPLDGRPDDLTRHFKVYGSVPAIDAGAAHTIGVAFYGEIAEVQVWDYARSPKEIKDSMHITATGKETGLCSYYRLGALVTEGAQTTVPDFSTFGRTAVVDGNPYAGAQRLNRLEAGKPAVLYQNADLVAVSERGTYEESFEFKILNGAAAVLDLKTLDIGEAPFAFSYWGKSSRGSDEKMVFAAPAATTFTKASNDGWFVAKSGSIVIPDGVSLLRAFEIGAIRGNWTAIDIRKHSLRLVSDSVTRKVYTDSLTLASVTGVASSAYDNLSAVANAERAVALRKREIDDLLARLDVAKNWTNYSAEKAKLPSMTTLQKQLSEAQASFDKLEQDPLTYFIDIHDANGGNALLATSTLWSSSTPIHDVRVGSLSESTTNEAKWKLVPTFLGGTDLVHVVNRVSGEKLARAKFGRFCTLMEAYRGSIWQLVRDGNGYWLSSPPRTGLLSSSYSALPDEDQPVRSEHKFDVVPERSSEYQTKSNTVTTLRAQIERLAWLTTKLAGVQETEAGVNALLTTARTNLTTAENSLATANQAFLTNPEVNKAVPVIMPSLNTDARGLSTAGALLGFARPVSDVRLTETCEGNVLLTYFDSEGRMRATAYDAASDSQNSTFEQWIPDGLRACIDMRDSPDFIKLMSSVTLPAGGWTCDAWVQFPLPLTSDGTPYVLGVVGAADSKLTAPIAIRQGGRLGMLVDGWFFDSGVDLKQSYGSGFHHLATTMRGTTATFYINGTRVGRCLAERSALSFEGRAADSIRWPCVTHSFKSFTVSFWLRIRSGATGLVIQKSGFFKFERSTTNGDVDIVSLWNSASNTWLSVQCPPCPSDSWTFYSATYDDQTQLFCVYANAWLVKSVSVASTVAASSAMVVGGSATAMFDIAEIVLWNTARTTNELMVDMYRFLSSEEAGLTSEASPADRSQRLLTGNEADLGGYWRMQIEASNAGGSIKDLAANPENASINGTPGCTVMSGRDAIALMYLGNGAGGGAPIGRLAEVRLWNLCLSDAEIEVNARRVSSGNEPGLMGYWPLDEAAGTKVNDHSPANPPVGGTVFGADWAACTAPFGHPRLPALSLPGKTNSYVGRDDLPGLASSSFTVECWVRRSTANLQKDGVIFWTGTTSFPAGSDGTNHRLSLQFTATDTFKISFYKNDVETTAAYPETDWHHWCCTYNVSTNKRILYRDGVPVIEDTSPGDFIGKGPSSIGRSGNATMPFAGEVSELRIWSTARNQPQIQEMMHRRATGTEIGLLACYPLDEANGALCVKDLKTGTFDSKLMEDARIVKGTSAPMVAGAELVTSEYSSVELSAGNTLQALMRRFYAFASGGKVNLVPEQRVEELATQWIGTTQINPTLLGYIEGAPPVPSENLTEELEDGYDGATTVTLTQSSETSYSWQRGEGRGQGTDQEGFIGIGWAVDNGAFITAKVTEGAVGAVWSYSFESNDTEESSVGAASSLTTSDSLTLVGMAEDRAYHSRIGARWLPKNVGYALVLSGMADVFVLKLKRSNRMVSYKVEPMKGVPLDVNTITFMLNPAYTLNGSLDGMVGSMPADPLFYGHVPDQRAYYGALYPASYMRIKDAYALKERINQLDKDREAFFYNTSVKHLDEDFTAPAFGAPAVSAPSVPSSSSSTSTSGTQSEQTPQNRQEVLDKANQAARAESEAQANQRKDAIAAKMSTLDATVRAGQAFAGWQRRMETLQTAAGKRNIVNTYVWDADGGLHIEEEGFANTVEHSIMTENSHIGRAGGSMDTMYTGFKTALSLVGGGSESHAFGKTLGSSKAISLNVDLSGVERKGITDLRDNPRVPGEKVDRYRFMSFYLEGSTDHFNDFFSYVVDPEWLMSNDEEARALRQAQSMPNKCWRVLHRVTYVERPALKRVGK